jgi:hypothetical protein
VAPAAVRLGSLGAVFAAALAAAYTAVADPSMSTLGSPHWAGYVATRPATAFTSATATWRHPRPRCLRGEHDSAAAIWVGLGGYDGSSQELEQVGSTAGCDRHGKPSNTAWFAVLPYPPHPIVVTVRPGDTLTGTVTILPTGTRLELINRTRGWAFARTINVGGADTTSAEWVVEPPMNCVRHTCRQAQLANFQSVTFDEIGLVANGQAGFLTASDFTVTTLELVPPPSARVRLPADALAGPVDDRGGSFTVTWRRGQAHRR